MLRKSALLLVLLSVAVFSTGVVGEQLYQQSTPLTDYQSIIKPFFRAPCTLQKSNLSASGYYSGYDAGLGTYTFFNPAVDCSAAPYPYAITDFAFTLYDDGAGNSWPQTLDIVVYAMADLGDSCTGPGVELCRFTMTPDQAIFLYPSMGSFAFPNPCCVDEPFFIGVEYPASTTMPVVSLLFDDQVADVCQNWMRYSDGLFYSWDAFWSPPPVGVPLFVVGGETNAAVCEPVSDCPVWAVGDPYKSENPPQLPDEAGWDVNATFPHVLADDFMCGETGFIKDIHFWGSWRHEDVGEVQSFILSFHSDIPADQSGTGYSMPGELLWEREIILFTETPITGVTQEGWYDPYTTEIFANDHQLYMQYDICLDDPADWFEQEIGTIYWMNVSANINETDFTGTQWGWKSTLDHWNDDAVYLDPIAGWVEMYEPDVLGPITNNFDVYVDAAGAFVDGNGTDFYGEGWYTYPSEWINMWFYDHPFDANRFKTMHVEFDIHPLDQTTPMFIEFALNWSTDQWSLDQLPGDSAPPLPGVDEALYIQRAVLLTGTDLEGHYVFDFEVPDYNPEWVSIDVRGYNFGIPFGVLTHQCVGQMPSMDLSFVITGDPLGPLGACCLPDGSCFDTDGTTCSQQGGAYQGDGTNCATADCNDPPVAKCQDIVVSADAACLGCGSVDAGSYDPNGDLITITENPGCPYPLGNTAVELIVTDSYGKADTCYATITVVDNTPPVAICPADIAVTVPAGSGGTNVTFAVSATDNCPGVTVLAVPPSGSFFPVGITNIIVTATDASGLIDVCAFKVIVREDPPIGCPPWKPGDPYKSENPPQLPDEAGWDVNATSPKTLADDFMCGETGYIKDIHFWGSWLNGSTGEVRSFILSFHEDIPASQSPTGHSMPGKLLWEREITVFTENVITGAYMEGWYDPFTGETLTNNHQEYFQYDICLEPEMWFHQEEGTIYWLNVSAIINETDFAGTQWGWKSSTMHWNDDAVFLRNTGSTCTQSDSSGTAHMPPDCPLVAHYGETMVISEGFPPGTTIEIQPRITLTGQLTELPEGVNGSSIAEADIQMDMLMTGTGALDGFSRTVAAMGHLIYSVERHPPEPGVPPDPCQTIETEIISMDLSLFGDPDFAVLRVRAGSELGLPSPGHTTLTQLPTGGSWHVDSFFDIFYEIEFEAAPGSALEGYGGSSPGTIRMGTEGTDTPDWVEMYEPLDILGPINNGFDIQVDPAGHIAGGSGEEAFGEGWYYYPTDEWYNVWFYDHPFDAQRFKTIHVEFNADLMQIGAPAFLELAINWSTDEWSLTQPATDSTPPLPGVDEGLYIARQTVFASDNIGGQYVFDIDIPDYNPEWVSIDVRGFNFIVAGVLIHECVGEGTQQSMDMSFVITGDALEVSGACCLPDGTCVETDAGDCAAQQGTYKGDGTSCSTANICGCCGVYTGGYTGNINYDTAGLRDLADITLLIDHVYINKLPLICAEEGNTNGDAGGLINLADITRLIDNIYITKGETELCQ